MFDTLWRELRVVHWNITEYNHVYKKLLDSIGQAFQKTDSPDASDECTEY